MLVLGKSFSFTESHPKDFRRAGTLKMVTPRAGFTQTDEFPVGHSRCLVVRSFSVLQS